MTMLSGGDFSLDLLLLWLLVVPEEEEEGRVKSSANMNKG